MNEIINEFQKRVAELYDRVSGGTYGRYYYFTWNMSDEISEIKIAPSSNIYCEGKKMYGASRRIRTSKKQFVDEMTSYFIMDMREVFGSRMELKKKNL
ncbi:hypothetical protein [Paenibacillus larvae]|uniref:Uncharacterized protein n=2 Tax=root TaxID=1 RepID=A0A345AVF3_9CAUD|nr:hypothetical protein [Paenibacillus larvae]YP_010082365.1 hypothetical protein KMD19_gp21 [Paenibacillus phage Scottie]MED2910571.1 hypothetical protein [Bacillus thuringiensis]AQT83272.1 hypothetical protein B1222_00390 [Paenibacillus larvae subsp. pulvifaciens]AQZ48391.1 hypothetical protein B5S25_19150 [Paenibacillus larvae subsp. pulvifaciens]AVF26392.1 hypothetical protein ERICIII_02231 [Paenibacillus larvae subsp. larvae]AVF31169.1 hypothetical protein ERICIV_02252 [Paenibacillus lar